MSLYACRSCGQVRVDDTECMTCGSENLYALDDEDGEEFVCPECGESFTSSIGLRNHMRTHEPEDDGEDDEEGEEDEE